jgi:hypothetical protein
MNMNCQGLRSDERVSTSCVVVGMAVGFSARSRSKAKSYAQKKYRFVEIQERTKKKYRAKRYQLDINSLAKTFSFEQH